MSRPGRATGWLLGLLLLAAPSLRAAEIQWLPASGGASHPEAAGAGGEPDFMPLVCRIQAEGTWVPGEIVDGGCSVTTPSGGSATEATYQVLVSRKDVVWKTSGIGQPVPSGAITAGRLGTTPLYICRPTQGGAHVGLVRREGCSVTSRGKTTVSGGYDVLAVLEAKSPQAGGKTFERNRGDQQVDCTKAVPSVASLWPADHNYRQVRVLAVPNARIVAVHQDECVGGLWANDRMPDGAIAADGASVELRAERDDAGDGRTYHIDFEAPGCTGTVRVGVPLVKDGKWGDQGKRFDSRSTSTAGTTCGAASPTPTPTATPTPPRAPCSAVSVNTTTLWPADGSLQKVALEGKGAKGARITTVKQDECVSGCTASDQAPDAARRGKADEVELRAERCDSGDGRMYTLQVITETGEQCEFKIGVPTTATGKAGDQGELHDSFSTEAPASCSNPTPTPTPEDCSRAAASIEMLYPATRRMTQVTILNLTDARIIGVKQDECVAAISSADTAPDAIIAGDGKSVRLKAENDPNANGRVYHIQYRTPRCEGTVTVTVPIKREVAAQDGGPLYDATASSTAGTNCTLRPPTSQPPVSSR